MCRRAACRAVPSNTQDLRFSPAHALPAGVGSYDGEEEAGVIGADILLACPVTILRSVPGFPSALPLGLPLLPRDPALQIKESSLPSIPLTWERGRSLMRSLPVGGEVEAVNLGLRC